MGQNGYAWWYVDALSADGAHGLTIIAFVGSVFSPYYALARARGRGDPENHVCMNVALYGRPHRWAMTERGRRSLRRDPRSIAIGASAMTWDGTALTIDIEETTAPIPSRLKGRVVVRPRAIATRRFALDAAGRHRWRPIAPTSDVEVTFEAPALSWSGTGYCDTNDGDEPLEAAFRTWKWARFDMRDRSGDRARVFYDVVPREGGERRLSLVVSGGERRLSLVVSGGEVAEGAPLPWQSLPTTGWGIARDVPCDAGTSPRLTASMENAPFYARAAVAACIDGQDVTGVVESLSLRRLVSPEVRFMLPFKMFRRAG